MLKTPLTNLSLICSFSALVFGCAPAQTESTEQPGGSVKIGDPCTVDSDCGDEQICSDEGKCAAFLSCTSSQDCNITQECEEGSCVDAPSCHEDRVCPEGYVCSADSEGSCIAEETCLVDADCSEGDFCSVTNECIAQGSCASRRDCLEGMICNAQNLCIPDHTCGGVEENLETTNARALVLFDRSCSMTARKQKIDGEFKWHVGLRAMASVIESEGLQDLIDWGLTFFPQARPSGSRGMSLRCVMGDGEVGDGPFPIGSDPSDIVGVLNEAADDESLFYPGWPCVTNLNVATDVAGDDPAFTNSASEAMGINNVILVTDGMQADCHQMTDKAELQAEYLLERNIRTYVIGFGTGSSASELQKIAEAGQEAERNPEYYLADDEDGLQLALDTIAHNLLGCEFPLESPPVDPSQISVFFNDSEPLPRDDANGWHYEVTPDGEGGTIFKVVLDGNACERWSSGDFDGDGRVDAERDIDIVFGCSGPSGG